MKHSLDETRKTGRPAFENIKSFEEFSQYYWYRDELIKICKKFGGKYQGTKTELIFVVKEYFAGRKVEKKKSQKKSRKIFTGELNCQTKLLDCGFCFNQKFRDFFSVQTGIKNFKFNTDMVATAKKVKDDNDVDFSLGDLLEVFYGKKVYAKFDKSSCQWNQFLKDFCADSRNNQFLDKLKTAAKLWKIVRDSTLPKTYNYDLVKKNYKTLISD